MTAETEAHPAGSATAAPEAKPRNRMKRRASRSSKEGDFVILVVLVAIHEVCHRGLEGGVVVSSLLAPSGAKAALTILLGLFFVTLRVALFVGAPAWAISVLAVALAARISRPCLYRG
jgi:hypothetical protein